MIGLDNLMKLPGFSIPVEFLPLKKPDFSYLWKN